MVETVRKRLIMAKVSPLAPPAIVVTEMERPKWSERSSRKAAILFNVNNSNNNDDQKEKEEEKEETKTSAKNEEKQRKKGEKKEKREQKE
uniref:Uncharacterized protein n=1 Tax=Knipowitschia caucasica TaxID=637954 RepID=A0AAV2KQY0_KNICA